MELILTIKDTGSGKSEKHYVICHDLISGVEDFCLDFGININDIVAVVVTEH